MTFKISFNVSNETIFGADQGHFKQGRSCLKNDKKSVEIFEDIQFAVVNDQTSDSLMALNKKALSKEAPTTMSASAA